MPISLAFVGEVGLNTGATLRLGAHLAVINSAPFGGSAMETMPACFAWTLSSRQAMVLEVRSAPLRAIFGQHHFGLALPFGGEGVTAVDNIRG